MPDSDTQKLIADLERIAKRVGTLWAGTGMAADRANQSWADTLDAWWNELAADSGSDSLACMTELTDHARRQFRLAENLTKTGFDEVAASSPLEGYWERWSTELNRLAGMSHSQWPGFRGLGAAAASGPEAGLGIMGPWLSDSDSSAVLNALIRFQKALLGFGEMLSSASVGALGDVIGDPGRFSDAGLTEISDAWLDSAERAYLDLTCDDDFAAAFGELVNSASNLLLVRREVGDRLLSAHGIVGESRIIELERLLFEAEGRIRELERQLGASRADSGGSPPAQTEAAVENVSTSKTTARKAAAKKTSSKRTAKKAAAKKSARKTAAKKSVRTAKSKKSGDG